MSLVSFKNLLSEPNLSIEFNTRVLTWQRVAQILFTEQYSSIGIKYSSIVLTESTPSFSPRATLKYWYEYSSIEHTETISNIDLSSQYSSIQMNTRVLDKQRAIKVFISWILEYWFCILEYWTLSMFSYLTLVYEHSSILFNTQVLTWERLHKVFLMNAYSSIGHTESFPLC